MEKLSEVRYLVVDDLLVVQVVIWLEVDARVRYEEQPLDLNQWQNLLHMKLSLELGQLTDVFQSALIKLDLLVRHYSARGIANRRIVKTLGHSAQNLKHFLTFIVKLISSGDIRLKKQRDGLEQVVDVTESNIDVQSILLSPVICRKCVLLVWLGCSCCARNLDQFGHFN